MGRSHSGCDPVILMEKQESPFKVGTPLPHFARRFTVNFLLEENCEASKDLVVGTGIHESVQIGPISGGITKSYPSSRNAPAGSEFGAVGKIPIHGSITYGGTKEILDVKRDMVDAVKRWLRMLKT